MEKEHNLVLETPPRKKQAVKIFVNGEIFVDQLLPFPRTKLTLKYRTNRDKELITVKNCGTKRMRLNKQYLEPGKIIEYWVPAK